MESATLNRIINRLLEIGSRSGKQLLLSETEITQLCLASREIFLRQPNLLEIDAPIYICGFSFSPFFFDFLWFLAGIILLIATIVFWLLCLKTVYWHTKLEKN